MKNCQVAKRMLKRDNALIGENGMTKGSTITSNIPYKNVFGIFENKNF